MKINPNFVAPCGLYCGVCAIYIADRDNQIQGAVSEPLRGRGSRQRKSS